MARTKNRARKVPEAQPFREASKAERKKQQEAKKSKREKKALHQASNSSQPPAPQTQNITQITGSEATDLPTHTASSSNISTAMKPYGDLATTHNVTFISIISSTSIEKKVTATLTHLSSFPAFPPAKEAVVMLHSKAKVVSKMVTVVEIAKREITAGGGKWFQYNVVETVMEKKANSAAESKEGKSCGNGDGKEEDDDEEEEDEGFETMKTLFERAIEGKAKVRAVPTMTTYLSRVRIEGLRKTYGEQTNGVVASD